MNTTGRARAIVVAAGLLALAGCVGGKSSVELPTQNRPEPAPSTASKPTPSPSPSPSASPTPTPSPSPGS